MIEVKNLRFQYPKSSSWALNGLNFHIERGEIFGFLGPSGSGKSTTQKILFKLLPGYVGSAKVEGKEVLDWSHDLYQKIGVSFELPNHYSKLTAKENLQFFKGFYAPEKGNDPMELLDRVGLWEDAHKRVSDFSKGMKMRLNFVRALLHDPDILFFDEPTSGLDPVNGKIIKDIILELKEAGKTIFITTHQMYDADYLCDRVAFIIEGQIKVIDAPEALKLAHSSHTVEVTPVGQKKRLTFDLEGLGQNDNFLSLIKENEIAAIHSKEATLEDVFIKLTGKSLQS